MAVEFEKFEITDQDLEDEFNINRRQPFLTKKQHLYGVFADEVSDEETERRPSLKPRKDYTNPISFVGGGIQQAGKKDEKKKEDEDDDEDDGGQGPPPGSSSEEEEAPRSSYPSQFGKSKLFGRKKSVSGGMRRNENEFGGWEKYTKGIGQKLLLQMGYQPGHGLGRDQQGIIAPIEAKQRKGRGALGLYGAEHPATQRPTEPGSEEEEDAEFQQKLHQWKKKPEEPRKKVKYVYKTAEDVIAEGGTRRIPMDTSRLSKVKVIDLTGPEQRILSGYHAIHQQHSKPTEQDDERTTKKYQNFAIPELTHNLNLLLDMTEQEIIRNDRQLRHERDQVINLRHEEEKLTQLLDQERKQIQTMEEIVDIVESLETRSKEGADSPLTLTEAQSIFRRLQDEFYEQYKLFELSNLAITIVFPLLKQYFETWQPLKESRYGIDTMKEWKDILESSNARQSSSVNGRDMDIYHRLVWEIWMPFVRAAAMEWNCRDCVPLIELLENWLPLLPVWVTNNILDQLVFPRLQQEVESWNPLIDRMYIHVWIHPWLPLMGHRLEPLYAPIRHKLSNAMVNWHPSDDSARKILQPWVQVFPRGAMDAFVVKNILPKLVLCMQDFVINPHAQHLEPWNWVMAWEEFLPLSSLVMLMEKYFFPKWMHVLCSWLGHNPNYDEVTNWYMGWKSMFPEQLLAQPFIRDQFIQALDIMNRAVSMGGQQPGAKEHFAYLSQLERQRDMDSQVQNARTFEAIAQGMRSGGPSPANLTLTFKDLVERKAEALGILFMPVPNRYQEAKQVYRFGHLLLYLDRGVIFVQNENNLWVPTSLQSLVELAR